MKPLRDCQLYAFVDTAYLRGRTPESVAQQLCDGGADLIQLRAKTSSAEQILAMAQRVAPILHRANVGLVINDYPAIAAAVQAPICHLGQEDFFDVGHTHVNEIIPVRTCLQVGLSTHAPLQAERAVAAGAHYVAIGPVFPTGTKPHARPVTLDYVRWAAANLTIPWFAIGGITLANIDAVLAAGARGICVVSALLEAPDLVRACQQFKDRLRSAGREPNRPILN